MTHPSYFKSCEEKFVDVADVIFMVEGHRLPAHSQVLASQSKLVQSILLDAHSFSIDQPLVFDQELQGFSKADVTVFLSNIYCPFSVNTVPEASAVLKLADLFDAPNLVRKTIGQLKGPLWSVPFEGNESVLAWLYIAERFLDKKYIEKCAHHAALNYGAVFCTHQYQQLGPTALKAVSEALHVLYHFHLELKTAKHWSPHRPEEDFAGAVLPGESGSNRSCPVGKDAMQVYKCRKGLQSKSASPSGEGLQPPAANNRTCIGHKIFWQYNTRERCWLPDYYCGVKTKVLPSDTSELYNLLGDLYVCGRSGPKKTKGH